VEAAENRQRVSRIDSNFVKAARSGEAVERIGLANADEVGALRPVCLTRQARTRALVAFRVFLSLPENLGHRADVLLDDLATAERS
jgi:hypothetical protein